MNLGSFLKSREQKRAQELLAQEQFKRQGMQELEAARANQVGAPILDESGPLGEGVGGNLELERGIKDLDGARIRRGLEAGPESLSSGKMDAINTGGQMLLSSLGADQGEGGGAATGALSGAVAGSKISPGLGTAIGAGAGALAGLMKARAARKQRRRQAQTTLHENLGQIEQNKGANMGAAIANLMQGMGSRR